MNQQQEQPRKGINIEDVGRRIDEDAEKLIAYLNKEVVPAVREHSSRGLRKAAEKLSEFADYLESTQRR